MLTVPIGLKQKFTFIAKQYGFTVEYKRLPKPFKGSCNIRAKVITLDLYRTRSLVALKSTFCHELAHAHCIYFGLYKRLHNGAYWRTGTYKAAQQLIRDERKVDLIGENLFKKLFPNEKFRPHYCQKHLNNYAKLYYGRFIVFKQES